MKYKVEDLASAFVGSKVVICEEEKRSMPVLEMLAEKELFLGKKETTYVLSEMGDNGVNHTVYVGIGQEVEAEKIRASLALAVKKMRELKVSEYAVCVENAEMDAEKELQIIGLYTECLGLISYEFTKYKKVEKEKSEVALTFLTKCEKSAVENTITSKMNVVEAVGVARDTINMAPNDLYPESFAKIAISCGEKYGFVVTVFNKEKLEEMGCKALLSVGQGSAKEPMMVVMEYNGAGDEKYAALVGKGLTFDAGGYNLKVGGGIKGMKVDMSGGAAVLGAMCAVAANKLEKNLLVVVPLAENLIGRDSYLPDSVIGSLAGKTIEIGNTDAEGRLILADALYYVGTQERVDSIVDIATLTGACCATFGGVCAGIMGNDDQVAAEVECAATISGEKVWRLPLYEEYRPAMDSIIADLSNISSLKGGGGSMTAAMFLREFVNEKPWIHVDMAGIGYHDSETKYAPAGATGYGTRLLYEYVVAHK